MNSVVLSAKLRQQARIGRRKLLKFNEDGRKIGESHHRAILTDHEIDLLLELREQGMSYALLVEKFEVSRATVQSYCLGRRRNQFAVRTTAEVCDE
jgi:DNA invertase Pin-like site-specific DNA recombinase